MDTKLVDFPVIKVTPDRKGVTRTNPPENRTAYLRADGSRYIRVGNKRVNLTKISDHAPWRWYDGTHPVS